MMSKQNGVVTTGESYEQILLKQLRDELAQVRRERDNAYYTIDKLRQKQQLYVEQFIAINKCSRGRASQHAERALQF